MREDMTERDAAGIELLLSQPEIVAWLSPNAESLPPSEIDGLGKILATTEHLLSRVDEIVDTTS